MKKLILLLTLLSLGALPFSPVASAEDPNPDCSANPSLCQPPIAILPSPVIHQ